MHVESIIMTRVHKFPESHSSNINCEHVYTQAVWEECPKQKMLLITRKLFAKSRESDFLVLLDWCTMSYKFARQQLLQYLPLSYYTTCSIV